MPIWNFQLYIRALAKDRYNINELFVFFDDHLPMITSWQTDLSVQEFLNETGRVIDANKN